MSNSENKINHCRICGYESKNPVWGEDGDTPSFDLCLCCGAEFGFDDSTIESVRKYRSIWIIEKEAKWFFPEFKPEQWSFFDQIRDVPKKWI
jgi:hypothetical protein